MEIEKLKLALMQYGDDLQLYGNGIAEDALGELEQTEQKILALASELFEKFKKKGMRPDKATLEYIEKLKKRIAELRNNVFEDEFEELKKEMTSLSETSNAFWKIFFAAAGIDVVFLTRRDLERISQYGIYNGNTVRQSFEKLKTQDTDRIFDTLSNALQKGKTLDEAWEEVKAALTDTRRFVKSEIDSIVNGVANDVSIAFAMKNGHKLKYSAVMDKTTCQRCRTLDGKVFKADSPELPVLPQHYNCRCQLIPVADGKEIDSASFQQYLKSLPKTRQKERLGNNKYTAWVRGDYMLKKYENPLPGQRKSLDGIITEAQELLS